MFPPCPPRGTRQLSLLAVLALLLTVPVQAVDMSTGNLVVADRSADPFGFNDYRGTLMLIDETSHSPVQLIASPEGFADPVATLLLGDGRILCVDMNTDYLGDGERRGVVWVVDPTVSLPGRADHFASSSQWVNPVGLLLEPSGDILLLDSDADPLGTDSRPGALFRIREYTHHVVPIASSSFWDKPLSMAYDIDGQVLIWDSRADPLNFGTFPGALFKVDPETGIVQLVFSIDEFRTPTMIKVDGEGNYLLLDRDANPNGFTGAPGGIYKIDRSSLDVEPYVFLRHFVDPSDFLLDPSGDIWVVDQRANPAGFPSAHGALFRCSPGDTIPRKTITSGFFRDLAGVSRFAGSALDSSLVSWTDMSGPPLQPGDRVRVNALIRNTGGIPGRPVILEHEIGPEWEYRVGSDSSDYGLFKYNAALKTVTWTGDLEVQGVSPVSYEIRLDDDVEEGTVINEEITLKISQVGSPFALEGVVASRSTLDRFVWADYLPGVPRNIGRILEMPEGAVFPSVIFEGEPLVQPNDVVLLHDGSIAVLDQSSRPLGPDADAGGIYRIDPIDGSIDTLFAMGNYPELSSVAGIANGELGELLMVDRNANPLGLPGQPGAVYSIDIETGMLEFIASDSLFSQPSDVILETNGTILVVDYDADPYGTGSIFGGEGALFEIDRETGAVHWVEVPEGTFVDPVGLAEGLRRLVYVADSGADPEGIGGNTGAIFEILRQAGNHVIVMSADPLYSDPTDVFVTSEGELIVTDREGDPFDLPGDRGAVYRVAEHGAVPEIVAADLSLRGPEAIAGVVELDLSSSDLAGYDLNGSTVQQGDFLRFEVEIYNTGRAAVPEAMATIYVSPEIRLLSASGPGEVIFEQETGTAFWFGSVALADTIRLRVDGRLEGDVIYGDEIGAVFSLSGPGAGEPSNARMRAVAPLGTGDLIVADSNSDPHNLGGSPGALFLVRSGSGRVEFVLQSDSDWEDPGAIEWFEEGQLLVADTRGSSPGVIHKVDYLNRTSEVLIDDPRLGDPTDLVRTNAGDLLIVDALSNADPVNPLSPAIFIQRAGEEELTVFCADTVLNRPIQIAEDERQGLWLIDVLADPNGPDELGEGALFRLDPETGEIIDTLQFPQFTYPVGVTSWTGEGLLIVDALARIDQTGTGAIYQVYPYERELDVLIADPEFRRPVSAVLSPGDEVWIVDRMARDESLPGNPPTLFRWDAASQIVEKVAASQDYFTVTEVYALPGPKPRLSFFDCEDKNGVPLNPDEDLVFRVRIENLGPVETKQVTLIDTLPVQVQMDDSSVRATAGMVEFQGRVNGYVWTVDLPPESSAEISYEARVHRGTQQGTEFKFRTHMRTQEGVHKTRDSRARVHVYYEEGNLYMADRDADPYELGGNPGVIWRVLLSNGLAVPMVTTTELKDPVHVATMPTAETNLLIVDANANPLGFDYARGSLWRWVPETGGVSLVAADSTFRDPQCILPLNDHEVLLLDRLADPFDLTRAAGPGAVYWIDINTGMVEPFASDSILSQPVSMAFDGAGGVFILDPEADPGRYGLRNGAVFHLDLSERDISIYAMSADFRAPIAAYPTPDGMLYVLDREVQIFPHNEARGAIYKVDQMGNVALEVASRQFRYPSAFTFDPQGRMVVTDRDADPRFRGYDTGAVFRRENLEPDFRILSTFRQFTDPCGFFLLDNFTAIDITDLSATPGPDGIRIDWRVHDAQFDGFYCMRADGPDPEQDAYRVLNADDPVSRNGPWEYLDQFVDPGETYTYQIVGLVPGGGHRFYGPVTAVAQTGPRFALHPPAPNPVRGETSIAFDLPAAGEVDLRLFDLTGRRVRTLADSQMPAGSHAILWDGLNENGLPVASGIYLLRLNWRERTKLGRIVLLH